MPCLHHPGGIVRGKLFGKCCYFCSACGRWFASASALHDARVAAWSTGYRKAIAQHKATKYAEHI